MIGTDYKHVSYGAKVKISDSIIESVEVGEISFADMQSLTGANGIEAHQEAVRKHFPERIAEGNRK